MQPPAIRINRNFNVPFILFEQGNVSKVYPEIELKILILKVLNQRVLNLKPLEQLDEQNFIHNIIDIENGMKRDQQVSQFTFMIDETDAKPMSKPQE